MYALTMQKSNTLQAGSLLLELVIALSLGLGIVLLVSSFLLSFVHQMNTLLVQEQKALQQGAVLDVFMRDLDAALACIQDGDESSKIISLTRWCISEHGKYEKLVITWYTVKGFVYRKIQGKNTPQVFGKVLPGLSVDTKQKMVRFLNEHNNVVEYGW